VTLGKHNLETIAETIEMARVEGFNGLIFERFVPLGQSLPIADLCLSAADWWLAQERICQCCQIEADARSLASFRAFWVDFDDIDQEPLKAALCNLGDEHMALLPNGDVQPCRRFALKVGNVLQQPFEEIIESLCAFSGMALKHRLTGPNCSTCTIDDCMGCRALVYALNGDYLADDLQCNLRTDARAG